MNTWDHNSTLWLLKCMPSTIYFNCEIYVWNLIDYWLYYINVTLYQFLQHAWEWYKIIIIAKQSLQQVSYHIGYIYQSSKIIFIIYLFTARTVLPNNTNSLLGKLINWKTFEYISLIFIIQSKHDQTNLLFFNNFHWEWKKWYGSVIEECCISI